MPASSFQLEEILPHRPPMILIDRVLSVDLEKAVLIAEFDVREEWKGSYSAIEYMAQAAAALAGCFDKRERPDAKPRPGLLLGTRALKLKLDEFKIGKSYRVEATREYSDENAASFACGIFEDDTLVAEATLNAYRPDDIGTFLQEPNMV